MSHRESLCTRREQGWSNDCLSCPLPWSPRMHKSSAGIAVIRVTAISIVHSSSTVQGCGGLWYAARNCGDKICPPQGGGLNLRFGQSIVCRNIISKILPRGKEGMTPYG